MNSINNLVDQKILVKLISIILFNLMNNLYKKTIVKTDQILKNRMIRIIFLIDLIHPKNLNQLNLKLLIRKISLDLKRLQKVKLS